MISHEEVIKSAMEAFPKKAPAMTLRQGDVVDSYRDVKEFACEESDEPTDQYLEAYHWGIVYLDAVSWKCYMPYLISYAIRHMHDGSSLVVDGFLQSVRPPDHDPPRLATLEKRQEKVISETLELLAFAKESAHQEFALQVMEEYWIPNALYRHKPSPNPENF